MKIGFYVLSIFCFVFLSCGDDKSTVEVVETEKTNQKPIITEKAIENFEYKDYALSSESEDAIAEWENYQELAIQISYLKKADLSFFNSDKEELKEFINDFKTATPKQFLVNPIISRTAILETMLLKLNENLTLDNIDGADKLQSVKEVLVAFSNLNYQINKKLEYDYYNKIKAE
ncbi:hypothetical protein [uncultured Winogradskyella sp.]|uniref:hypothetical protein n=1 Tax=uncultured Winogradskyella sp. TaxID=395353 RepID=UPI00262D6B12|nr:hypothetical protein [uncultured Winogradskyella sp.]